MDHIERRDALTVKEFVECYLEANTPVVLGPEFTRHWAALSDWVTSSGTPNFARLSALYPDDLVEVADCDTAYFSDHQRTTMRLSEFLEKWQKGGHRLYCKDWHFTRSPSEFQAFLLLPHLSDDWLNTYYEGVKDDDYKFAYMGGEGTWTAFHEDVFRSYSWSANICGSKQWILVPPEQNDLFTDVNGHWVHNLLDYDQKRFPRLHELKKFDVVQGPGETMFVPAGWWHQVRNLEDTISINHNWANEFNLQAMYERLRHDLEDVRRALSDVTAMDGFEDHVQVVLKANSGMDFDGFFAFVEYTAKRYLTGSLSAVDSYFTEPESVRRALNRIDNVLMQLGNEPTVMLISGGLLPEKISGLRVAIKNSLEVE
ncbi:hypothetical protein IWW38_000556 [Coemansia aciculifera]|uniref:Uncharacterized protein n=1 Tax=Coemansia aciculifera TaxID=417176 RepID=A0ACC1MAM6_9FUNG|nr:hypothetical protein IWW38_000556 [Coemansia aciculifera]